MRRPACYCTHTHTPPQIRLKHLSLFRCAHDIYTDTGWRTAVYSVVVNDWKYAWNVVVAPSLLQCRRRCRRLPVLCACMWALFHAHVHVFVWQRHKPEPHRNNSDDVHCAIELFGSTLASSRTLECQIFFCMNPTRCNHISGDSIRDDLRSPPP